MKKYIMVLFLLISASMKAQTVATFEQALQAANNGIIEAYAEVGYYYFTGDGVARNYTEAIKWFRKGADNGDTKVYPYLGLCYYNSKNYTEALKWLKKAADNGETQVYSFLGGCYFNMDNITEAIKWFRKSVDNGETISYFGLGVCYYNTENYTEALKWLKKAADNGVTVEHGVYGWCYLCLKNYSEAKRYAELAINTKGSNDNMLLGYRILSLLYAYGYEVPQDKSKALEFVSKIKSLTHDKEKNTMLELLDTEGEVYLVCNEINEAKKIFEIIKKESPDYYKKSETVLSKYMNGQNESDVDFNIPISPFENNLCYAVIISNENYQIESKVPFAINDGRTFTEYCSKTLGIPTSNIHFVTNATYNNIRYEINWLRNVIKAYNGKAKVIFYYAGHGIPDEQNKNAYLLPVDGYGTDVVTGYALSNLYKELSELPSQSVTIFLDACFSGTKREGDMLSSARGVAIKVKQTEPTGNLVVFSAAQGDETAYPYKEKGHGMFTYYLLKKLQETKGNVTLEQLGDYIKDEVSKKSIVINGKPQTPTVIPAKSISTNWINWTLK